MKNEVFTKTNMADAAILNFEKMLQFANRLSNCHQISSEDRAHKVLSATPLKNRGYTKTNVADAAILTFKKPL